MQRDSSERATWWHLSVSPVAGIGLVAACLVLAGGCGGEDWQAETFPASGRITVNGQPPAGAVVTLHPLTDKVDQRGSNPWGIVQEDGTFPLSTYAQGDGAPAGEYAVTVRWPQDVTDMAAALSDRLGGAYAQRDNSPWRVTITEGDNQLPPIEIEGARLQPAQAAAPQPTGAPLPARAGR